MRNWKVVGQQWLSWVHLVLFMIMIRSTTSILQNMLTEYQGYRQTRPVVLFIASAIYHTISSAMDLVYNISRIPPESRIQEKFKFQLILGIYIAINIFILALTFYFMRKVLSLYVKTHYFVLLFSFVLMLILADDLVELVSFPLIIKCFTSLCRHCPYTGY